MNNDSRIKLVIFDVDETVLRFLPAAIALEEDKERYKNYFLPATGSAGMYFMLYPNVRKELQELRDKGIKIGFCSDADQELTLQKLRLIEIRGDDDFVCCSSDGFKKPHPAPLLRIAEHFCVDPQNCLAVGNDRRDWIAAALAGMISLWRMVYELARKLHRTKAGVWMNATVFSTRVARIALL